MFIRIQRKNRDMSQWRKKIRFDISLWVAVSAIVVLAVISTVSTMSHFQKQKEKAVEIFLEKGSTLINTFEAGLRDAGDEQTRYFELQKLVMAVSEQPDIDYLIVTDHRGNIIADSDPSMVFQQYGLDLDTENISRSRDLQWRQMANPQGAGTFEVYRGLSPRYLGRPDQTDVAQGRRQALVVYLGFNMDKIEKAVAQDTRNTIVMTLVLLLVGSLAIISLFLVQAYRLTRTSLSRVKIFSETLIKNMPIGLIAVDEKGHIGGCNEKAQEILETHCSSLLGKKAAEILPGELESMLAELPERGGLLERDIHFVTAAGQNLKWEAVAAGLVDDGEASGKILLLRDVTRIRELEQEVAQSRHLRSLSSLAAGVAHEIRNPLSSIKGFAVYLKERLRSDSEDKKTADIIIEEVERLNRVITQLIEFARPLELKKETTRLSDLVWRTMKLTEAQARENNIDVIFNVTGDESPVDVDSDKIRQVFLNIFLNAMAAMKTGGKLEITLTREGENVRMVIADNGSGIREKDLPRIYDPYFTSKPAGTGLGLAVVQKIMEAHGGKIKVESVAGKGTAVSLFFPL
jgi:two-component system sensor histidine kinase HydH